jgi:hypothetical protein
LPRGFTYRYCFAAFLLFAFLAQHFSAGLILVDYVLRTDAYARQCINKERPALKCKGKCQMMRKMAEQEKQSPALPDSPSLKLNIWCQVLHEENALFYGIITDASLAWAPQKPGSLPTQDYTGVFHPPRLVA